MLARSFAPNKVCTIYDGKTFVQSMWPCHEKLMVTSMTIGHMPICTDYQFINTSLKSHQTLMAGTGI